MPAEGGVEQLEEDDEAAISDSDVQFAFCGAGNAYREMLVGAETSKRILLSLTGAFYLAAAIQIILYRSKPKVFDDKQRLN